MNIRDWSSDVCSSDLPAEERERLKQAQREHYSKNKERSRMLWAKRKQKIDRKSVV